MKRLLNLPMVAVVAAMLFTAVPAVRAQCTGGDKSKLENKQPGKLHPEDKTRGKKGASKATTKRGGRGAGKGVKPLDAGSKCAAKKQ